MSNDQAPKKARESALARYGGRCGYCGRKVSIVTDHMTPISKGGTHDEKNLMPVCVPCNSLKRNRTIQEFRDHLRIIPRELRKNSDPLRLLRKRLNGGRDDARDHDIEAAIDHAEEMLAYIEDRMALRNPRFYFELTATHGGPEK